MANQNQTQSQEVQLTAIARGAENFLRWSSSAMLRGGRVTKFKGVSASFSPELGLVSSGAGRGLVAGGVSATLTLGMARRLLRWSVAPLALLAISTPAFAQAEDECVLDGDGGFICEDNGDPLTVEPALKGGDDDLRIVLEDGFDIDTSGTGRNGLDASEFDSVTIRQESGSSTIIGDRSGLDFFDIYGTIDIITGGDVTGLDGDGIYLDNEDRTLNLDTTAGAVTGSENGIEARNNGDGNTVITTGDVDGEDGNGINVTNAAGSGDIAIDTTAGTVFGRYSGIVTQNQGNGATTIITADVDTGAGEGGTRDGINAVNGTSATDLIIDTSAGSVTGLTGNGIVARNNGTGETTITTGDVDALSGDGINAQAGVDSGDFLIDSTGGAVLGRNDGIDVANSGTGSTTVITGNVTAVNGDGVNVQAYSDAGPITIDTSAGTVNAGRFGILTGSFFAEISVTTADVNAAGGNGITINTGTQSTGVSVDSSAGAVTGSTDGIEVNHGGSGDADITTGDVTGDSDNGITASISGPARNLNIDTTAGTVTGGETGIDAANVGTGTTNIVTGDVAGLDGSGINFGTGSNAGDIAIDSSAGTVTGSTSGIRLNNFGTGSTALTTADVTGSSRDGIFISDDGENGVYGADMTLDTTAGMVAGGASGIYADNRGTGDLSITTADVSGANGVGIEATNDGSVSGDLTIDSSAGTVTGTNSGVVANNEGTGAVSITTSDVDGGVGNGVFAQNTLQGAGITIDTSAGSVTGGQDGIRAENYSDVLSITTADVTGAAGFGINADNRFGTDIVINTTAGTVTSLTGSGGIIAFNGGTGDTTITTGDVSSYGEGGDAIAISNSGVNLSLDTTGGRVYAYDAGAIDATNTGTGATSITTADVVSNGGGTALKVFNYGTDVTVNTSAGSVAGNGRNSYGIQVFNRGSGAATITTANVTGDTAGGTGDGVYIYNGIDGDELILDTSAGAVVGAQNGIRVRHYGDGQNATITTADVTGLGADGINVQDDGEGANGADITINTALGTVTGAQDGIEAFNFDTGDLSITTANVDGEAGDGINATNQGSGTGVLTIDTRAGAVTGGNYGIFAQNNGTGSTSITTANVTGDTTGIAAISTGANNDITIDTSAGAVSGGENGIAATNYGTGDTAITTADVTGESGYGIYAYSGESGGGLAIDSTAGAVSGSYDGIKARQNGYGSLSVTTADVTGETGDGIDSSLEEVGAAHTIDTTAGTVTGAQDGIRAFTDTDPGITPQTTITTANVTGTNGDGISAEVRGDSGDITIDSSAGAISGGADGINVRNEGIGDARITTAEVIGATGDGIDVYSGYNANNLTIDTSAGAVSGLSDGIQAAHYGFGDAAITTADVTGTNNDGVYVYSSFNSGSLTIDTSAGAVSGGDDGVEAYHQGYGTVTITTGDVSGGDDDGIRVRSYYSDVVVNSVAGSVIGSDNGISVSLQDDDFGSSVSITTADVSASGGDGIRVDNEYGSGDISIDSSVGAVTGSNNGISTYNRGYGAATTITTGDVTGESGAGIVADTYGEDGYGAGGIAIDSSAGSVTGATDGIVADNGGFGDLSITTANVAGQGAYGIQARNRNASTGNLTIDSSAGAVSGETYGIIADNSGTGDTTVTTSDVTAFFGVDVIGRENSGDLTLDTSQGEVSGVGRAVRAINRGAGAVAVTTGDVTSTDSTSTAVSATGSGAFVTVDTTAGAVVGGAGGVFAANDSALGETLSITTSDVTTLASYGGVGSAIYARTASGDVIIDSTAGNLSSAVNGVSTRSQNGSLSIATANVDAAAGSGITADVTNGDVLIDTTAGAITAGTNGIEIDHQGTGSVLVATGNVTAADGDGFSMVTGGDTLALDIDTSAGAIVGSNRGIFADHQGTGDLTITVGNVTGQSAEGILASTTQIGADIFVTGAEGVDSNVIGATNGMGLTTQGANITVTGLDSVTGQAGDGLNLVSNGGNISVSDIGTITGIGGNGIFANADSGNITIDNVGFEGGITATGGIGIAAYADNGGTITIGTSGPVSGDTYGVEGDADNGGDIIIDTTNYDVTGAIGILAVNSGEGSVDVTTADVTGAGGNGIFAETNGGNLSVDSIAGSVSGLINGIAANNFGTGSTTITTGDVSGTTLNGLNAFVGAGGEALIIDTSAGSVSGGVNGIYAGGFGTGDTTITTADVDGASGDGIALVNTVGSISVDTVAGTVSGGANGIEAIQSGEGDTTITTADVSGGNEDGIVFRGASVSSGLLLDTALGFVSGGTNGINVDHNGSDEVTITTGDVTGTSGDGIAALIRGTDLLIDTSAGAVTGGEDGINAVHVGTGTTTIFTGDVSGLDGDGVSLSTGSDTGDILVDTSAGALSADQDGVDVSNFGKGSATIITADITATNGNGIDFNDDGEGVYGADVTINTTAGSVTSGLTGINAINRRTGDLTITSADVSGSAAGINAQNLDEEGGDIFIDTTLGTVTGTDDGIRATNFGIGTTTIITADLNGGQDGLAIEHEGSELLVDTTAGTISGGDDGVDVRSYGNGSTTIATGDVNAENAGIRVVDFSDELSITTSNVSSALDAGITVYSTADTISIDTLGGAISGGADGINVANAGEGDVSILTGNVTSALGGGIVASNIAGAGGLAINTLGGTVQAATAGIEALNEGAGVLDITTADVIGANGDGISATVSNAALVIDTRAGTVVGTNAGIFADQQSDAVLTIFVNEVAGATGIVTQAGGGATDITLSSTALVTGTQGVAIDAVSAGGDVTVQGSSGTVFGATDGVVIRSAGGDIAVSTLDQVQGLGGSALNLSSEGGDIDVTAIDAIFGTSGSGILADAGAGDIAIAGNGDITGGTSGITAITTGSGSIEIDVSGVTTGDAYGVDVSSEGTAVRLTNSGSLSGGAFAVFASGDQTGEITLRNEGTVTQAISFASADDSFDNRDLFAAGGISDFGDGTDELLNLGSISVMSSAEFIRLEQLNNAGLITLANNAADGSLIISGDFVGSGGTIALDVDFAASSADVLTIGGAATGTTQLMLNPLDLGATFDGDLVLVNAGAGTQANAFEIAGDTSGISEFLAFELVFDASANDFLFGLALEPRAFEAAKLGEGAQALWYRSADAWSDHRANARFDQGEHAPVWAVFYGAESERDQNFADPTGLAVSGAVLDYSQDFFGIQAGVEKQLAVGITVGLTGGFLNSNLQMAGSGVGAEFDALNVGASVAVQSGGLFAEALVKFDDINGDVRDPAIGGFNGALDGSAFGTRIELGYRLESEGFYAEPNVSLEFQNTDLDSLNVAGQNFDFVDLDGLRGAAGIRVGTRSPISSNAVLGVYLDANIVHEFEGEGITRFSSALDNIAFANDPLDTYGRVEAGVTLDGEGPVSGFFKAQTDVSSEFSSFGGSAGVRIRF